MGLTGALEGGPKRPGESWATDKGLGSVLKDFSSVTIKSQQTILLIHSRVSFNT